MKFQTFFFDNLNFLRQSWLRMVLLAQTARSLETYRNSQKDKTIFIVGNGPSLTSVQLEIASHYPYIALNRAYQLFPPHSFDSNGFGYLIINDFFRSLEVLPNLSHEFKQVIIGCHNPSSIYSYTSLLRPNWVFANCAWGLQASCQGLAYRDLSHIQKFSADFSRKYYAGWSVLFSAIQFAAFLGVSRIILLGCDMNYSGPLQYSPLLKQDRFNIGHLGSFDYEIHGRPHMLECRKGLSALGIQIFNASPTGSINEIPRISHDELSLLLHSDS